MWLLLLTISTIATVASSLEVNLAGQIIIMILSLFGTVYFCRRHLSKVMSTLRNGIKGLGKQGKGSHIGLMFGIHRTTLGPLV